MDDSLVKLRPDRDLQCYFFRPSAIAALSNTSANGFTLSGSWRQQFDWAVIEWNRDNVFEHPLFRNLPDGDLSGLTLTYDESRSNCILLDSSLYPTVDWPSLRIWADSGSGEQIYKIPLKSYAVPIEGRYSAASATIQLGGAATAGDYVGFAFQDEHYPYLMNAGDPLDFAIKNIADGVNAFSKTLVASQSGTMISLQYVGSVNGARCSADSSTTGADGNRFGLYTYISGSRSEQWNAEAALFSGGASPTKWRVTLPFGSLVDPVLGPVPAKRIRKMRWTYAADLQPNAFVRSEFQVDVSNWQVSGSGRSYSVAGPGSRRINDDSADVRYSSNWTGAKGNFFGGTIHSTTDEGASVSCTYVSAQQHSLYLATRIAASCGSIQIEVDGTKLSPVDLNLPGEDVLIRSLVGQFEPGSHTVSVTHVGPNGSYFYFDFLEIAIPWQGLATTSSEPKLALATDWDTDHSIALAPERTAWILDSLGFKGRVNHYAGALWFYELLRSQHQYASGTISFSGTPDPNLITQVLIGRADRSVSENVAITHLNLIGDTAASLAKAFELQINAGYTAIWAQAKDGELTIYSRSMGADGNAVTIAVSPATQNLLTSASGPTLAGGVDGDWRTDLTATPRVNRAARDWTRGFCRALKEYGHDTVALAFSTELQHGDPSIEAGIAQRYPSGLAVSVNTPALQTNFAPASTNFWSQVYADMAQVQTDVGLTPYLQFGEIQWWYFPDGDHSGMPYYDAYTTSSFRSAYARDMTVITNSAIAPDLVPQEAAFLPALIGAHTSAIRSYVRSVFPGCRFEVLYPTDVNATPWNQVVNYPSSDWTPDHLACLKTESFGYTNARNLDLSWQTIRKGVDLGFASRQRSHLVGIGDSTTSWLKEARMAEGQNLNSVVLFALDQFCLIGYPLPLPRGSRRSVQQG